MQIRARHRRRIIVAKNDERANGVFRLPEILSIGEFYCPDNLGMWCFHFSRKCGSVLFPKCQKIWVICIFTAAENLGVSHFGAEILKDRVRCTGIVVLVSAFTIQQQLRRLRSLSSPYSRVHSFCT
jgi:hypothetical protein